MHTPQVVSLDEYLKLPVPQYKWLVPNLIPTNSFTVLWGPPKSGKTLLSLQLGVALSTSGPFLHHQVGTPYRVLYVQLDTSQTMFRTMLTGLPSSPNLYFPSPEGLNQAYPLNLLSESSHLYLHSLVVECQPHIVMVDCLSELGNQDENDQADMKQIVSALKRLTVFHPSNPCACFLLHHTVKFDYANKQSPIPSPLKAGRGSGYLAGAADAVWFLHRNTSDADPNGVLKIVPRFTNPSTVYLRQGTNGWWGKV